jgi:hypothetical protein
LACQDCQTGNNEPLCKKVVDACTSNVQGNILFGIQVTVNGDNTACAVSGFIKDCLDYASIERPENKLGACKTCSGGKSPAMSTDGQYICLTTTNLITNCTRYDPVT